jgi:DNA-binding transcriptional MerR regulator
MRIGEVAAQAGVTVKTVRYYESLGLVEAGRADNGYREYGDAELRLITEVRALSRLGIRAEQTRPFLDCLGSGSAHGDDCPQSLDAYREAIEEMTHRIAELTDRRDALVDQLARAARRGAPACQFSRAEETP